MQNRLKELKRLKSKLHDWGMMLVVGSAMGPLLPAAAFSFVSGLLFPTEDPNFLAGGVFLGVAATLAVGSYRLSSRKCVNYKKQIEQVEEELKVTYGLPQGINLDNLFPFGADSSVILHTVGTRTEAYTLVNSEDSIRLYNPQGEEIVPNEELATRVADPKPVVYTENEQLWQTATGGK